MAFPGTTQTPEGYTLAGADTVITQGPRQLGFASDLTANGNFNLQGIRVLGRYEYIELKSLGFDGTSTIGTFLMRNPEQNIENELWDQGWQPDGSILINEAGLFNFIVWDFKNQTALMTLAGAKIGGFNITVPQTGLVTKSTDWQYLRPIPGLFAA